MLLKAISIGDDSCLSCIVSAYVMADNISLGSKQCISCYLGNKNILLPTSLKTTIIDLVGEIH